MSLGLLSDQGSKRKLTQAHYFALSQDNKLYFYFSIGLHSAKLFSQVFFTVLQNGFLLLRYKHHQVGVGLPTASGFLSFFFCLRLYLLAGHSDLLRPLLL